MRIGNDGSEWSIATPEVLISDIYSGGYYAIQLTNPCRYITVRRIGAGSPPQNKLFYEMSELRIFAYPNLLQSVGSKIIFADTTPWDGLSSP